MIIRENISTPVTYSTVKYNGSSGTCTTDDKAKDAHAGYDTVYKARSDQISNAKDAYGFRRMSPFQGVEQELRQPTGRTDQMVVWGWQVPCGGKNYRHTGGLPKGIESIFRDQVYRDRVAGGQTHDLLAMRAEANLKQQDINVLQFAAFLPATLKNIAANLRKMDNMLDVLHDPKKLRRLLGKEDPRSLYLQWLFVWNQLYRDVVGGARFLRSKARPIGSLVTGRARNTAENEEVISKFVATQHPVGYALCTTRMLLSQRAVSVARVTCDVKYQRNALGLDNPAYLMWDLVKWSWVVDQITDIGLFISSITSMHGLEFLGTSITDRVVNETTVVVDLPQGSEGNWAPGFSRRKSVKRVVRENPTQTVTIRNPFQNSVMVTAAVAAALSMKAGQSKDILTSLARAAR